MSNLVDNYPLAAYNFRVSIDGMDIGFSEVSGLVQEYQTLTYRHGMSWLWGETITKFPLNTYSEVTLNKGVVCNTADTQELYNWLQSWHLCHAPSIRKSVTVSLLDESGSSVVTWKLLKALATKLEASSLQADSNEVAIDTLTLMATGISVEYAS